MSRRVYVVGVGMTKFEKPGRRENWDYPDMVKEAGTKALKDAGISYSDVQQVIIGYVYGDSTCGQRAVYQLGLSGVPIYNVNNNCSTGSSALFLAKQLVEGGIADCVLAVGFEKMARGSLQSYFQDRTNPLDKHMEVMVQAGCQIEAAPFAPQMFGNAGKEHMEKYGTTQEQLAKIAEKNHRHSAANPYSQFQDVYTLEQILKSPKVFGPLTKLQCCPTSDGAACAVLASEDFVKKRGLQSTAVEIVAMAMATDLPSTFTEKSCIKMVGYDMTRKAAQEVYRKAGVEPKDVQVIELHDCFSANELITYEALGLCPEGQAGKLIDQGQVTYGGKWVVNPSGGLISKGHPLGATGLAQCAELCWQLRGMAGKRQVPNVRYALQHNIGLGGAVVVALYRLGFPEAVKPLPPGAPNPAVDPSAYYTPAATSDSASATSPAMKAAFSTSSSASAATSSPAPAAGGADGIKSAAAFAEIEKRVKANPEIAKQINGSYLFKITAADGSVHQWVVDLKSAPGSVRKVAPGESASGECTILISDSDFIDILSGKLSGQKAFMEGKLKTQGNLALAMKMSVIFGAQKTQAKL